MFTHGSRCAIIGLDVTACTVAAPASGGTHHLGHPCPELACGAQFGDRHELVVVGGEPETDLTQRLRRADSAVGQQPQVADARGDGARQLPRRARAEVVECRPVDGDGTYAAVVTDGLADGGHHLVARRRSATAQCRGQRVGAEIDRKTCSPFVVEVGDQCQHRVGGGGEVSARIEHHRDQFEEHALEEPIEFVCAHACRPDLENQRADTLRQRRQHRTVSVGHRNLPWRGKRLDDLPAGLHVAQRVGTPDERPPTRQRRLRLGVEDGVERADRKALIGRRVQKLFGRFAEFRGILATAFGQHAGNRGTPLLAIRLRSHGCIYRHRHLLLSHRLTIVVQPTVHQAK